MKQRFGVVGVEGQELLERFNRLRRGGAVGQIAVSQFSQDLAGSWVKLEGFLEIDDCLEVTVVEGRISTARIELQRLSRGCGLDGRRFGPGRRHGARRRRGDLRK